MRLLTLLATAVLLAACVRDVDETIFFPTESGASLTIYMDAGGELEVKTEVPDDPWDTISEKLGLESVHTGKRKSGGETEYDDPWDTIQDNFGAETVHTNKSDNYDDPWDSIRKNFDVETTHVGKSDEKHSPWDFFEGVFPEGSFHKRSWRGHEKSSAVFVSFRYQAPTAGRARVTEIRGKVQKLEFADGAEQYVVYAPASWTIGTQIETAFHALTTKKSLPWLGVRVWRTVAGEPWDEFRPIVKVEEQAPWPKEYVGASLLARLSVTKNDYDDPWDRIQELFPSAFNKNEDEYDDPWDRILVSFGTETVHTGRNSKSPTGRNSEHDDPWDTIRESFGVDTVHTGNGRKSSAGENSDLDDPWDSIHVNFGARKRGEEGACDSFLEGCISRMVFLTFAGDEELSWGQQPGIVGSRTIRLVEVRGQVGRFEFVGGGSLFGLGLPETFMVGAELQLNGYLLDDAKLLPLAGAVVWAEGPTLR